jgi:undecaprenyldiphospho-muramoylpentapeptide beta-N-acetylglucosaminyltransferase
VTRRIIIAGGGTGGHVFVASAIADALGQVGWSAEELCFIGSKRGMERELLATRPSEVILLGGRGIKRSWKPRALLDNLAAISGLSGAVLKAMWIIGRQRPSALVSVGGYAALPAGLAAWMWRCPIIVVNVDASPGRTNQLLGAKAKASCVAFAGSGLDREVVTGAPVREEFINLARDESARRQAKQVLGVRADQLLVSVVTGSLGASSINRAVAGLRERWQDRDVTIYHVTGLRDAESFAGFNGRYGRLDYRVVGFEDNVAGLYQASDVAITRAGALTVAELCVVGLPAVLIPLPGAPGDHQTKNAQALVSVDGARLLADADLSSTRLDEILSGLLDNAVLRDSMAQALLGLAHPHAAQEAVKVVLDYVR